MKEQGLDTVDIITAANAESEIQHSSSSEENVEMNVCDEEYEDRSKDGLVDSNIENSISNTARSIEDVEKSMNKEFNKIWMALSSITLNLSNLDTKCECRELSNQLLKNRETVLKLEATIETKENEIASLKEIIAILKETQNAQDNTSVWENVTQKKHRTSQPPPIWPNTPDNPNSMPVAQANRFEILSNSFQTDDTHGPCTDSGNEKNAEQRIDEKIKDLKEKTKALLYYHKYILYRYNIYRYIIYISQSHLQQSTENATRPTCLQRASEHQSDETCKVQEKTASSRKPENSSRNKKPEVYIVGDSIVRNLKGNLMSKNKTVKVRSFPGSTIDDMTDFIKPILRRAPESVITHPGTNDLKTKSEDEIIKSLKGPVEMTELRNVKCSISLLTIRKGHLREKGRRVNELIKANFSDSNLGIISNDNIDEKHLNGSGLHLNQKGTLTLATNFISHIKSASVEVSHEVNDNSQEIDRPNHGFSVHNTVDGNTDIELDLEGLNNLK